MPESVQNILGAGAYQYFPILIVVVVAFMLAVPVLIYAINLRKTRHQLASGSQPAPEPDEAARPAAPESPEAGAGQEPALEEEPEEAPEEPIIEFKSPLAKEEAAAEPEPQIDSGAEGEPAGEPAPSEPAGAEGAESPGAKVESPESPPAQPESPAAGAREQPVGRVSEYDDFDLASYSSEELVVYDLWGEDADEEPRMELVSHKEEPAGEHRLPISGKIEGSGYSLEEEVLYDDWEEAEDMRAAAPAPVEAPREAPPAARTVAPAETVSVEEPEPVSAAAAEAELIPAGEEATPVAAIELDPYPDVELPEEEEEVAAEPIHAVHEIDLSPDGKFHEHQFRYFLDQFRANLEDWSHERPRVAFAFLPGPDDVLERNVMPQLFWKPAALHDERRYRLADHIMPQLYFHAMRKSHFMPVTDADDRLVYMHLVNYALWRDRTEWIYNLAAFFDESRIPGDDLFMLGACLARMDRKENLAGYYFNRARDKNKPLHAVYYLLAGDDKTVREMIKQPGLDAGDFAWLGWLYAGTTGDHRGERKVMARLAEKQDVVSVLDLFAALLMRGRLFLAGRLLLRHPLLGQHSDAALRAILQLYFRNGKYLLYLNRLEKSARWPGRATWFEVYFCVHRLGGDGRQSATFRRLTAGKHYSDLPTEEEQAEFLEEMADPRLRVSRLEIHEIDYFHDVLNLAALLGETERIPVFRRSSQEAEQKRIKKVYAVIQYILEEDLPLDRLELYLRAMSGALLLQPSRLPERLFKRLRSLSGRNLIARMLVGLYYFERGNNHAAIDYLEICQMRHPLVMHRMAEMLLAERRLWEAEEAYRRILRFYPDEPIFWYNLGVILEKNGRPRGARLALEKALGINPNFKAAANRLAKLKLQQPAVI